MRFQVFAVLLLSGCASRFSGYANGIAKPASSSSSSSSAPGLVVKFCGARKWRNEWGVALGLDVCLDATNSSASAILIDRTRLDLRRDGATYRSTGDQDNDRHILEPGEGLTFKVAYEIKAIEAMNRGDHFAVILDHGFIRDRLELELAPLELELTIEP